MKLQFLSFGESELIDKKPAQTVSQKYWNLVFQGAGKKFIIQLH